MPWQKGVSGNPKGRPKKDWTMTDFLRQRAKPGTKQEIADRLLKMAADGNLTAMKYVYDRLDGMPRQALEVSGPGEEPIGLVFVRPGEITENRATSSTG